MGLRCDQATRPTSPCGWSPSSQTLLNDKLRILDEARAIYQRGHTVTVRLASEAVAFCSMPTQHEDDMPQRDQPT
jgi:hypothetical protein